METGFRIAGIPTRPSLCLGFSLWVYSVYTLDRALGGEEDDVNREELSGANAAAPLALAVAALAGSAATLVYNGLLPVGAILPALIGYLYSEGVSLGPWRLSFKGGRGGKNVVVAVTWSLSAAAFAYPWLTAANCVKLLLFFTTKVFIGSVIYDYSDIEGDLSAGIDTLPIALGRGTTRRLLLAAHLALHACLAALLLLPSTDFPAGIAAFSFANGAFYIYAFTRYGGRGKPRDLFVDGEWVLIHLSGQLLPEQHAPPPVDR